MQAHGAKSQQHERATTLRLRQPALQLPAGLGHMQSCLKHVLLAAEAGQRGVGSVQLALKVFDLFSRHFTLQAAAFLQQLRQPIAAPLVMRHGGVHLLHGTLHLLDEFRRVAAKHRGRPIANALKTSLF